MARFWGRKPSPTADASPKVEQVKPEPVVPEPAPPAPVAAPSTAPPTVAGGVRETGSISSAGTAAPGFHEVIAEAAPGVAGSGGAPVLGKAGGPIPTTRQTVDPADPNVARVGSTGPDTSPLDAVRAAQPVTSALGGQGPGDPTSIATTGSTLLGRPVAAAGFSDTTSLSGVLAAKPLADAAQASGAPAGVDPAQELTDKLGTNPDGSVTSMKQLGDILTEGMGLDTGAKGGATVGGLSPGEYLLQNYVGTDATGATTSTEDLVDLLRLGASDPVPDTPADAADPTGEGAGVEGANELIGTGDAPTPQEADDQLTGGFVTPGASPAGTNPDGTEGDAGDEDSQRQGQTPSDSGSGDSGGADDTDDADDGGGSSSTDDSADDAGDTDDAGDAGETPDAGSDDATTTTPDMGDAGMVTVGGAGVFAGVDAGRLAPDLAVVHPGGDPVDDSAARVGTPVPTGPLATSGSKGGEATTPAPDSTTAGAFAEMQYKIVTVGPSPVDGIDSLGAGFEGVGQTGLDDALKPDDPGGTTDDDADLDGDGLPG